MRRFIKNGAAAGPGERAGKLKLLLSGFSRQEMVRIDDLVASIDRLPGFHLEGLREIVYLPECAPGPCAFHRGLPQAEPKGEFVQQERRIFLYAFDSAAMLFHMLHHEVGHFVFFLVIGSRVKKRWVTELFPGSPCVTAYAGLNPWEDFAETYAHYVLQPRSLEARLPEKHAFMRDCVFSGRRETLKESDRGPG